MNCQPQHDSMGRHSQLSTDGASELMFRAQLPTDPHSIASLYFLLPGEVKRKFGRPPGLEQG